MKINYVHTDICIIPYSSCIFIIDLLTDMIDKLHYHKRHWKYWLSALTYIWICYQPSDIAVILKEKGLFHVRRRAWILWGYGAYESEKLIDFGLRLSFVVWKNDGGDTFVYWRWESVCWNIVKYFKFIFFPRAIYLRKGIIAKIFFRNTLVCAVLDIL